MTFLSISGHNQINRFDVHEQSLLHGFQSISIKNKLFLSVAQESEAGLPASLMARVDDFVINGLTEKLVGWLF